MRHVGLIVGMVIVVVGSPKQSASLREPFSVRLALPDGEKISLRRGGHKEHGDETKDCLHLIHILVSIPR